MSLHEAADGILETHVTWEDVETDLQEKFSTKATFETKKTAINISDMKGFASRIALIEPDWQNVEKEKDLPKKFALKIPSLLPMIEMAQMMNSEEGAFGEEKLKIISNAIRESHNREVYVYKTLLKFNHPDVPFTKMYSSKSFDENNQLKGYLITEFVPNIHNMDPYSSISVDDIIPLVRGIATFAALCELLPSEETKFAMGRETLDIYFKQFLGGPKMFKKYEEMQELLGDDHRETAKKASEVFIHYYGLLPKYTKIFEILGLKMVLNHGDLWHSNMLYSKSEDGNLKLEALIDWQTVTRVSPGLDISRVLFGCISGKDRREKGNQILKCYYDTFTKVYGEELFSFNELLDCYKLYAPLMAMLSFPEMITFISSTEKGKEEAREKEKERLIAMIEDILEVHESNLKRFPDFIKN